MKIADQKPTPVRAILQKVVAAVSEAFKIPTGDLLSRQRNWPVAEARFVVYFILYDHGTRQVDVGEAMGNRGHDTISHGVRRCKALADQDDNYRKKFEAAVELFKKEAA